ncbi:tight adherence protein C [Rhodobacter sp. 140A]|nr:tight adherence protein C [Rhodobacter sp. 140A]
MSDILNMLTGAFGPMGPVLAMAVIGLLLVVATLPALLKKQADPLDKLRATGEMPAAPARDTDRGKAKPQKLRADQGSDKLDRYAGFLEPKNKDEMTEARKWLQRAGYRSPSAVRTFHAIQFAMGLGLLGLGIAYTLYMNATGPVPLTPTQMILYVLLPGAFGYIAPKRWVNARVNARTQEIQDGFPDALDMLLVCVEAGQSLDQGIVRVAKELQGSYPAMAEEFETVAHEIKAGLDKAVVLRAFGERSGVMDVMSFTTVMIQSQQFGTSIADALRLYAADMRDKRVMRAEEAANKIPTKMTLGTMMFTVPPLLIILVGPSVHDMLENFKAIGVH